MKKFLISDTGKGFASVQSDEFLKQWEIQHNEIAMGTPQANE